MTLPEPRILDLPALTLNGLRSEMSFAQDTTAKLWQAFMSDLMPHCTERPILYNVQIYPDGFFRSIVPQLPFQKWACIASEDLPLAMKEHCEELIIPAGLYACFHYKGSSANAAEVFSYILGDWMPKSDFRLDYRPFYEVLGPLYKPNDHSSEEEIRIPVIFVR